MQILSPIEVKNTEVKRIEEHGRILASLGLKIAEKSHEFNTLTDQTLRVADILAKLESKTADVKREHKEEIAQLLEQKAEAMKPVDALKEEWKERIKILDRETSDLRKEREATEKAQAKAVELSTDLEYRIQNLDTREKDLDKRENGITLEEARVQDETSRLTTALQGASRIAEKKEQSILLREKTLKAREDALEVLERTYREDRGAWEVQKAEEKAQLSDERKTLERLLLKNKK